MITSRCRDPHGRTVTHTRKIRYCFKFSNKRQTVPLFLQSSCYHWTNSLSQRGMASTMNVIFAVAVYASYVPWAVSHPTCSPCYRAPPPPSRRWGPHQVYCGFPRSWRLKPVNQGLRQRRPQHVYRRYTTWTVYIQITPCTMISMCR